MFYYITGSQIVIDDDDSCSEWPPCGGCSCCMLMQADYYGKQVFGPFEDIAHAELCMRLEPKTRLESEAFKCEEVEERGRHKSISGLLDVGGDVSFDESLGGFGMLLQHSSEPGYLEIDGVSAPVRVTSWTFTEGDSVTHKATAETAGKYVTEEKENK